MNFLAYTCPPINLLEWHGVLDYMSQLGFIRPTSKAEVHGHYAGGKGGRDAEWQC